MKHVFGKQIGDNILTKRSFLQNQPLLVCVISYLTLAVLRVCTESPVVCLQVSDKIFEAVCFEKIPVTKWFKNVFNYK